MIFLRTSFRSFYVTAAECAWRACVRKAPTWEAHCWAKSKPKRKPSRFAPPPPPFFVCVARRALFLAPAGSAPSAPRRLEMGEGGGALEQQGRVIVWAAAGMWRTLRANAPRHLENLPPTQTVAVSLCGLHSSKRAGFFIDRLEEPAVAFFAEGAFFAEAAFFAEEVFFAEGIAFAAALGLRAAGAGAFFEAFAGAAAAAGAFFAVEAFATTSFFADAFAGVDFVAGAGVRAILNLAK